MSTNDSREPIMFHVHELIARLKNSLIYFVIGFAAGYWYSEDVLKWIMIPIKQFLPKGSRLVYTQPFEQVFVLMKMSVIMGIFFSLPFIFSQVYFFIKRGLTATEAGRLWTTFLGAWLLGVAGIFWSYKYLLPSILSIVLGYQTLDVSPVISLSYYVNACVGMLLIGALFFEIPFFMILTSAWGWVAPSVWSKNRKYALVVNAIVSAILSPPDVASMLVMMIPVQVLYEIGHLGARFFSRRHRIKVMSGEIREGEVL